MTGRENERQKELLARILKDHEQELKSDNCEGIFDSLGTSDRNQLRQIFDNLGIDYLSSMTKIPDNFFAGSDITYISIPENVQEIGKGCFSGCSKLSEVSLPNGFKGVLPANCFEDCSSLEKIFIPDGCTGLGPRCFRGCDSLKKIVARRKLPLAQIEELKAKGDNESWRREFIVKDVDVPQIKEVLVWIGSDEDPQVELKK